MAHPILMPKPGQMTEECILVAWHKREGDAVKRGDVLFEIETDKSVMDVESFDEGVLLRRCVEEGQTVPVNTVCAYVGEPGEALPAEIPLPVDSVRDEPVPSSTVPPTPANPAAAGPPAAAPDVAAPTRLAISPRAGRLAAASGIDPTTLVGTGPDGRITERDVQAAIDSRRPMPGSEAPASSSGTDRPAGAPAVPPDLGAMADEVPLPLSRMRRVIAERLTRSATSIPQFHVTVSVDMTRLLALRAELRDGGLDLSVTDFIAAATARTLAEFPEVNSRTDGETVWLRRRVHLGLAVSVPNGLVVAVLRDADRLALAELHERVATLATAARNGSLGPDDLTGSTFTVSNLGMFGVDEFDAIINPGEAAILAVSSVLPTAVAASEGLAVRQVMKLTLTADHRLVDGELGARFLNALRRRLQDVEAIRPEAFHV